MDVQSIPNTVNEKWNGFAVMPGVKNLVVIQDRSEVSEWIDKGAKIWIDIQEPTTEDTQWLSQVFGFHDLALTDVLNNAVRPKQELYDDVLFTVLNAINLNHGEDQLDTINLNIFLTENYIVSTHCNALKTIKDTLATMKRTRNPLSHGTDRVYYLLLDGVVNRYLDVMDEVDVNISALEREVFDTSSREVQEKIFIEKRRLAYLKRSIIPKRDAVRDLVLNEFPQISTETRLLLRDVLDHIMRIVDGIESYRELTSGLMDSYMSNISNKMNEVMKLMSIIATVMLPLSFLTGLFGMNFDSMPGLHFRYGFWVLMAAMTILIMFLVWFFKRRNIL